MNSTDEIVHVIDRLQAELEDLALRGLRSVGPANLAKLKALHEEFERVGAGHLADRIGKLSAAIAQGNRHAAIELLRTQASVRVFERVLTLRIAGSLLEQVESEA